jgi:tetratricopeptide (TPR) repeat protein
MKLAGTPACGRKMLAVATVLAVMIFSNFAYANEESSVLVTKGSLLLSEGELVKAIKFLEKAQEVDPDDLEALYYLGLAYSRSGKNSKAEDTFVSLLDKAPQYEQVFFEYGMTLLSLEKFEEACPWLDRASAKGPAADMAETYYQLGYCHYETEAYAKALPLLKKAARKDKALAAQSHYFSGLCHYRLGNAEQAQEAFKKVIYADPSPELATSAQKFLATIKTGGAAGAKWWRANAGLAYQYDSNVMLWPSANDGEVLYADIDGTIVKYEEESDNRAVLTLGAGIFHQPKEGARASFGYGLYQSWHGQIHKMNLTNHGFSGMVGFRSKRALYTLPVSLSLAFLDIPTAETYHQYSLSSSIAPTASWMIGDSAAIVFSYVFKTTYFPGEPPTGDDNDAKQQQAADRDAYSHSVPIKFLAFFDPGSFLIGYTPSYNAADGDDWVYLSHQIDLGFGYNMKDYGKIDLGILYKMRSFANDHYLLQEKREDSKIGANLSYALGFLDNYNALVGIKYVSNTTTPSALDAFFTYDRLVATLGLSANF